MGGDSSASDELTLAGEDAAGRSDAHRGSLGRGATVGRYTVLARVGSGGMGVVYAAYDPELDRKVAIKVLHGSEHGTRARGRRLAEAKALAKLSHPNVVTVHDVGMVGEHVFIAMEFVAGTTLRRWCEARPRAWPEVLEVMLAAARGLAAVHAAGLVHHDFKPDNVIVGDDARARVTDFGLARLTTTTDPSDSRDEPASAGDTHTSLTEFEGTPAYMAAEQLSRAPTDARTDQFGFCVTLWEALYGERPFAGETLPQLAVTVLSGTMRSPPRASRVPAWLARACRRGLAADPGERWPTMQALIDAIARAQQRARRRRVLGVVGLVALAGAGVLGADELGERRRMLECAEAGASIEETWNEEARARVREALLATKASYAAATADRVMPWLDAQAEAWRRARVDACVDAGVRRTVDAETYDRSRWCLDDRRLELDALVTELSRADDEIVQKAVSAAASLVPIEPCRDASVLARLPAPPPDVRARVQDARTALAHIDALRDAGKYADALARLRDLGDVAWPPLQAAVHAAEADLLGQTGAYEQAERIGSQAYFDAASIGAWGVAADAATQLVWVVGSRMARHAEGLSWAQHAALAERYAGDPGGLREARRKQISASVRRAMGDYKGARELAEASLRIREAELGLEHPHVASIRNNLGNIAFELGDYPRALEEQESARAIWETTLGTEHPDFATSLANLGNVHAAMGDNDLARARYEQALAIRERALGPDHPHVGDALNNLAVVHSQLGDLATSRALSERALAIREASVGSDHPAVANALQNLASTMVRSGDPEEAMPLLERAIAIQERALGPGHLDLAMTLYNVATIHLDAAAGDRARPLFERAVAIRETVLGKDHPDVAIAVGGLAQVALLEGDHAHAATLAERALAVLDAADSLPARTAGPRFTLAQALWPTPSERERAVALARRAREEYREAGPTEVAHASVVEAWLAQHDERDTRAP